MLKASFIIPTKNSGKTIEQCLSSLIPYYEQGYIKDIIVVDALSTDDTLKKARRFPVKILPDYSKVPNMTFAFEIGWRNSAGDPIVFFDSDAYLGEGFFPKLLDFFQDRKIGVVGCEERPVVSTNRVSIAVSQWKVYAREALFSPKGLGKLHRWISVRNEPIPPPTGPCHVVRRSCIEAVGGYKGISYQANPDMILSRRIMSQGWKACWWLDSPLYHYTRATLKSLLRQYAHNGVARSILYREKEFRENAFHQVVYVVGHLGAPLEGLILAGRWKNPLHLFLYPLVHYTYALGYLVGLISKLKSEERIT